jgi:drug/metabolite transporter (DMT)-like permease
MTKHIHRWAAILLVLIAAASYGMMSPIIKLSHLDGWNGAQITVSQIVMSAIFIWTLVLFRPKRWSNPLNGPWIRLALIGIFGMALTIILFNHSLSKLDASLSIVLMFQFTWITVVMESIMLRRRPTRAQSLAIGIILIGTVQAVGLSTQNLRELDVSGIITGFLSAVSYSLFLTWTGRLNTNMDAVLQTAVMLTATVPVVFIVYPPSSIWVPEAGSLILWGLAIGLLGQVLPILFYMISIPKIGSSFAALLGSFELPVALIGSLLILGETIGWLQWVGMAFIMAGIVISENKAAGKAEAGVK